VDRVTSVATAELTGSPSRPPPGRCGRLIDQEIADRLIEAGDGIALLLDDLPPGRLDTLPVPLNGSLSTVRDAAHACITKLGPDKPTDVDLATARKLALSLLDDVHDTAVRLLAHSTPIRHQHDVVWLSGGEGIARQR